MKYIFVCTYQAISWLAAPRIMSKRGVCAQDLPASGSCTARTAFTRVLARQYHKQVKTNPSISCLSGPFGRLDKRRNSKAVHAALRGLVAPSRGDKDASQNHQFAEEIDRTAKSSRSSVPQITDGLYILFFHCIDRRPTCPYVLGIG